MQSVIERQVEASPERVLAAVAEAAEMWGGSWQQDRADAGELRLPVVQGLRQLVLQVEVLARETAGGTILRFNVEEGRGRINRSAFAVLLLGGLGGLTVALWPLSPRILQLAPLGAVLAIVAWLLVVARLRYSGIEDFLELVTERIEPP